MLANATALAGQRKFFIAALLAARQETHDDTSLACLAPGITDLSEPCVVTPHLDTPDSFLHLAALGDYGRADEITELGACLPLHFQGSPWEGPRSYFNLAFPGSAADPIADPALSVLETDQGTVIYSTYLSVPTMVVDIAEPAAWDFAALMDYHGISDDMDEQLAFVLSRMDPDARREFERFAGSLSTPFAFGDDYLASEAGYAERDD